MRTAIRFILLSIIATALLVPAAGEPAIRAETPLEAARLLASNAGGDLQTHFASELDAFDFVRAAGSRPLARVTGSSFEQRARSFLARYGAVIGMTASERRLVNGGAGRGSELRLAGIETDTLGMTHVRFDQFYRDVPVFAAQILVHLDRRGIVGVNGTYVPRIAAPMRLDITSAAAREVALTAVRKAFPGVELRARDLETTVLRLGLVEGRPGRSVLTRSVEVSGDGVMERVFVDGRIGAVLLRAPLLHTARDRKIYTPVYAPRRPELFVVQEENGLQNPVPMIANLYRFAGQVYDFFFNSFGRDSYDARGATMRSVYLVNQNCPNAYWNGLATNYCPGFDLDDVVAHEWGHAYTEYSHNLVYLCQAGALNESYSDIWGETIDLINGEDGIGGSDNEHTYPGQRWIVGEDLGRPVQEALLRDMWDPERLNAPAKVSSENYECGAGDGGGVHTNSGVPNHAYAMLVDGKTFNGVTVRSIGMTKAAHIYYRAMTAYQVVNSRFPQHEQSLKAACDDLIGKPLKALMTGATSNEVIGRGDCAQVAAAAKAVEFSKPASQCGFKPKLEPGAPPICPGGRVFYDEDFEDGLKSWTLGNEGNAPEAQGLDWTASTSLPDRRRGSAAFAPDPNEGSCVPTDDVQEHFWMDGPTFKIPAGIERPRLRFDHWIATDPSDGGNVAISVNGAEFEPLPDEAYLFNRPKDSLDFHADGSQQGWGGADGGDVVGSWGATVADLSELAKPGDSVRLRFHFTLDCGSGITGWYVDDVQVYDCPVLPAPIELKLGSDYRELDPDGTLTLSWKRPEGAVGPDAVQDCTTCIPFLSDDAESGLGRWDTEAGNGAIGWRTGTKPAHDSSAFFAVVPDFVGLPGAVGVTEPATATMTLKTPLKIPSAGVTKLTFKDFYSGQPDDIGAVEVFDRGSWSVEYLAVSENPDAPEMGFTSDPLRERSVDLTKYAGREIGLRLRHSSGPVEYIGAIPLGWWVDDLSVANERWRTLATVAGTTYKARLGGGTHSLRVTTAYAIRGKKVTGDASAPVTATIAAGVAAPKPPSAGPAPKPKPALPATGLGSPTGLAVAALAGAAVVGGRLRRKRL